MFGLCEFCWNFFSSGLMEIHHRPRRGGVVVFYVCDTCGKNPHVDSWMLEKVEGLE